MKSEKKEKERKIMREEEKKGGGRRKRRSNRKRNWRHLLVDRQLCTCLVHGSHPRKVKLEENQLFRLFCLGVCLVGMLVGLVWFF